MSVTYGFYNSNNGDRKYNARQISGIFDGIINDGIFQNYLNHFNVDDAQMVGGTNGMYVYVNTGRAWLDHTWTLNDSPLKVNIDAADLSHTRKDTVVIEVNETTRTNSIKVVKGTPSSSPEFPTLTNTSTVHQHILAHVIVEAGATSISRADIVNLIGQSTGTPYVTGLFETMSIDEIVVEWQNQWDAWLSSFSNDANRQLEDFMDQYTENADAALIALLNEALGNHRGLRVFGDTFLNADPSMLFPKTPGATKTYSQSSPIHHTTPHDFKNDIFPNTNIKLGDYLIDGNGYIAKITYLFKPSADDIVAFSVESTGLTIVPQSLNGSRVLYYITGGSGAELPSVVGEQKSLASRAIDGVMPYTRVKEGDILIGDDGSVVKILENPYAWDEQSRDYFTDVECISSLGSSGIANETIYTSLELTEANELKIKLHNVRSYNGLYIKVQKLTGRSHNRHIWKNDPIGFADLKGDSERYGTVPIPEWMPNSGVFQTKWAVTSDIIENGLTINPAIWLLDSMKPIFTAETADNSNPSQSDALSGFADGSYVAFIGEYLASPKAGRIANSRKYSLDIQYRFVLVDSNDNVIGTTSSALAVPYKTFWTAGKKRNVKIGTSYEDPTRLTGGFKIVAN